MKIQIVYADKSGGHCKVLSQDKAEKLLNRLARRRINATIFSEGGKRIGACSGETWGYAMKELDAWIVEQHPEDQHALMLTADKMNDALIKLDAPNDPSSGAA